MKIWIRRSLPVLLCLLLALCTACGEREPEQRVQQTVIDGQSAKIIFDPQNAAAGTVETEKGMYTFAWESADRLSITYPDGFVYIWGGDFGSGTVPEGYIDGLALAWALESAYGQEHPRRGNGATLPLAVLLAAVGIWFLWKPQSAWWLAHGWRYRNAEPSELALGLYRAGGGFLLLVAVICALAAL